MKTIEEVRNLVFSAFENVEASPGQKQWTKLGREYVEQHWSSMPSMSPAEYQNLLPAMLIASLDDLPDKRGIVWTTLYVIGPSDQEVHFLGRDNVFESQIGLFTVDQFRAVSAFLGLFLDEPQDNLCMFTAARAFKWGWDRVETPERARFAAFDAKMHGWIYDGNPPEETARLAREFADTFANVPYPGDLNICGPDRDDEAAESALDFRSTKWQCLHPLILQHNYTSLSLISSEGFRYYLPAYVMAELYGLDSESNADCVFHLTHGFFKRKPYSRLEDQTFHEKFGIPYPAGMNADEWFALQEAEEVRSAAFDWFEYSRTRMAGFTNLERIAIIHYLEYSAERDDINANEINKSLETYWRPSVR